VTQFPTSLSIRTAALAALCAALALTAHPQAKPIQPTSQGPVQSSPQTPPQTAPQPMPPTAPPSSPQGSPQSTPQTPPPQAQGAPTPYTLPDNTASITLPPGWKANGGEGLINLAGPTPGEAALLGKVTNAHNAAYNPNAAGANNTALDMPYSADFKDKVAMVMDRLQVIAGRPVPQGAVTSVTPIPVPPDLGQCGSFTGNMSSPSGNLIVIGALCVQPLGSMGDYKTIVIFAQAPAAESATFPQLAQQLFASYNVPINYLETLLKPFDQPPTHIVIMNPVSTQCFEMAVLHGTPQAQLPRACGGTAP
jgi:hypothetical protein